VASKADVSTHLNSRYAAVHELFGEWEAEMNPEDRADLVEAYFKEAALGESQRVGNGASVYVSPTEAASSRQVNILVIGRHDVQDLVSPTVVSAADATMQGPGTASRLGPTVAFGEGVQAARALTGDDRVAVSFLSLGEGDSVSNLSAILPTAGVPSITIPSISKTGPDAVFLTNSTSWSPQHPTITTGCRGELTVQLSLQAGQNFDDFLGSGALRNPLTKMAQILGKLRDDRGRIAIDDFYNRAQAPGDDARAALSAGGHDPDQWAERADIARFSGRLSTLERATLWPGFSVLDIGTDSPSTTRSPASAVATVAFYLVPDQRHSEVEAAVRRWFLDSAPAELRPSIHVLSSTRPFRESVDSLAIAAQTRAAYRVHGQQPIHVPAGGPAGSGEVSYMVGAPVAFAGISPPSATFGTTHEALPWSQFSVATELAAETILQLRRG